MQIFVLLVSLEMAKKLILIPVNKGKTFRIGQANPNATILQAQIVYCHFVHEWKDSMNNTSARNHKNSKLFNL